MNGGSATSGELRAVLREREQLVWGIQLTFWIAQLLGSTAGTSSPNLAVGSRFSKRKMNVDAGEPQKPDKVVGEVVCDDRVSFRAR
jgi:hypothetical protein